MGDDSKAILTVRVTPRAGRSAVVGYRDGMLLVKLAAPPVDGAANEALVALLAAALDVPKRAIEIVSGAKSRTKRVAIADLPAARLEQRLKQVVGT